MTRNKIIHGTIIFLFTSLYFFVSIISMLHVIDFFDLSNTRPMSWALSIAFELGAAASLASIVIMEKMNKVIIWGLFIILTAFQMMGNMYNAFANVENYQGWIEMFGLQNEPLIMQKRILAAISGAILPVVALGYIKALVDYLKPTKKIEYDIDNPPKPNENLKEAYKKYEEKIKSGEISVSRDHIEKGLPTSKRESASEAKNKDEDEKISEKESFENEKKYTDIRRPRNEENKD